MDLKRIKQFVEEANQTNSINDKKEVVGRYEDLIPVFKATYSPFIQYNITSKNVLKDIEEQYGMEAPLCLEDLLQALSGKQIKGNKALGAARAFIKENMEYKDVILSILDKNLKTRTDAKLINKVFPKAVPTFNVALANKYEDRAAKIDLEKDKYYASHKLDGLRCIAIPTEEGYRLFSRQGKEFTTLNKIVDALNKMNTNNVFDGEICILDDEGDEHFDWIMKEIRKKDHEISSPRYKIFDCLTIEEFDDAKGKSLLSERYKKLYSQEHNMDSKYLDIVEQHLVGNEDHLIGMFNEAIDKKWEGLILRKDVGYEGKRTNNLLKMKKMHDAEYVVNSIETGPFRIIENGKEIEEEVLARVNIEHKGNTVGVGSGFSISQRRYYKEHPEEIIGKTITVQFFEETQNADGDYSLRFPVVKHIYGNGRDV